jgi:hypothetical protein
MFRVLTSFAFAIHIAAGAISPVSGLVVAFAGKGGNLHRKAGTLFGWSMFLMAAFSAQQSFAGWHLKTAVEWPTMAR